MSVPVLDICGLSKRFTLHEQGASIESCTNVSLSVWPGQLTALTGPTGKGKSSVLKCAYRTYLPFSGHLWLNCSDGRVIDLACASESDILRLRHTDMAFVTQFLHCLPRRSALQLVMDPLIHRGASVRQAQEQASGMLEQLGIPESLWSISPATFSGGERQRINLARALVVKPRLLLLDEPTASLDAAMTQRVVSILQTLKREGVAMLAVFHDMQLVQALAEHHLDLSARPVPDSQPEMEIL